jgi:hypothetical protein
MGNLNKNDTEKLFNCVSVAGESKVTFDISRSKGVAFQVTATHATPCAVVVAAACVSAACNSFTEACHGFATGLIGQVTTSAADLPCGLCVCTNYFAIASSSGVFQLASSKANAIAGTAICLGDAGTGNHTFTPTAACGACGNGTVTFHPSVDRATYPSCTVATAVCLSACNNHVVRNIADTYYNQIEVDVCVVLGQFTIKVDASKKS